MSRALICQGTLPLSHSHSLSSKIAPGHTEVSSARTLCSIVNWGVNRACPFPLENTITRERSKGLLRHFMW